MLFKLLLSTRLGPRLVLLYGKGPGGIGFIRTCAKSGFRETTGTAVEDGMIKGSRIALWPVRSLRRKRYQRDDLEISAKLTTSWPYPGMMDQFASIGVEFDLPSLKRIIEHTDDFYEFADPQSGAMKKKKKKTKTNRRGKYIQWASDAIYERNRPFRPWSLGAIQKASGFLFSISGDTTRTPGMYRQVDPKTSQSREKFLQDTNERVHSSVRVRLACRGLGLNDKAIWTCAALADWKLKRAIFEMDDEEWYNNERPHGRDRERPCRGGWIWRYVGAARNAPRQRVMMEEPLGPYERYLLELTGGTPNVFEYAARRANRGSRSKRRSRSERSRRLSQQGTSPYMN
ncbi:hypothetical protein E4U52_007800 [Claviceps spartinae]|nr:hypothetical protein E4U52_007800 [Claviceps spartinae]